MGGQDGVSDAFDVGVVVEREAEEFVDGAALVRFECEVSNAADKVGGGRVKGDDVDAGMMVRDDPFCEEGVKVFLGDARPWFSVFGFPAFVARDGGGGGDDYLFIRELKSEGEFHLFS